MKQNSHLTEFKIFADQLSDRFSFNTLVQKLDQKKVTLEDYQRILLTIFHQTYTGPLTFALAAVHCRRELIDLQAYLLHHAEEEKDHWQWILEDLKATGYTGPDPRTLMPTSTCLKYISLNYYVAEHYPVARLGIAAVLEMIGAKHGKKSFLKVKELLNLQSNQVKFFYGHGDTDVGHTHDLFKILEKSPLTDNDWKEISYFAEEGAALYAGMYEEAARSNKK